MNVQHVYDLKTEKFIPLRPYMMWDPYVDTSKIDEDRWEAALKNSVTNAEYQCICDGRKRMKK